MNQPGFFDATCEDLALFSGTPVPAVLPAPKRAPAPRQLALDVEPAADLDQDDPGPLWN